MKKVTATKFKVNCLKILDEVCVTQQPVLICKGKEIVAKLIPFNDPPKVASPPKDFLGCLAGIIEIVGDIESPVWPTDT